MGKVAIVYIGDGEYGNKGKLSHFYEGPANQSAYGSDHGKPEITKHLEVPEGFDTRAVEASIHESKWIKPGENEVYAQPMREMWTHNTTQAVVYIDPEDSENYTQGAEADPSWTQVDGPHVALTENSTTKENLVQQDAIDSSQKAVTAARAFANKLIDEFAGENRRLGIIEDDMTGPVITRMQNVLMALYTGSLPEAIVRVKAIPTEDKDPKYITDARLLVFVNKTRQYLGLEPVESLAEA